MWTWYYGHVSETIICMRFIISSQLYPVVDGRKILNVENVYVISMKTFLFEGANIYFNLTIEILKVPNICSNEFLFYLQYVSMHTHYPKIWTLTVRAEVFYNLRLDWCLSLRYIFIVWFSVWNKNVAWNTCVVHNGMYLFFCDSMVLDW